MSALHPGSTFTLVDELIRDQQQLTAVERFSALHERGSVKERYSALLPARSPNPGEQYAFEVNLDACTGCKACVVACHSLNGLDDDESFRDVGLLVAPGYQQTVTTACHHCEDPACSNGCPVKAYEKDPVTGIVQHLDDQCIGCQYCVLKCPYDVPKYNERLGIVRKCDMCAQRLGVGEAPACVQACPNGAIKITLRPVGAQPEDMLPSTFDASYTRPTTTYTTTHAMPANARAGDTDVSRVQHAHWPLVIMLLLTQAAVGLLAVGEVIAGCAALFAGLTASVFHLGRPLGAWRFFLGLKTSWMSREILAFSILAGVAPAAFLFPRVAPIAAGVGAVAIFTSAMIYIDTRRTWWRPARSFLSFYGLPVILASSLTAPSLAFLLGVLFLLAEFTVKKSCAYSSQLERSKLRGWRATQLLSMLLALCMQPVLPMVAAALWGIGFLAERVIFFQAVDSPKMPGGVTE
jgi:formate dehydrogenase iron-sulfur subunit